MINLHLKIKAIIAKILLLFLTVIFPACDLAASDTPETRTPLPALTPIVESSPVSTPTKTPVLETPFVELIATPPPTIEPSPLLERIKAEILATNCSPPCMFDLFPGQTKADEGPGMLESLIEEGIVQDFFLNEHPNPTRYIASFPFSLSMVIEIDEAEDLVLDVGFGTGYRLITFADVINRFGEPGFILPTPEHRYEAFHLLYPEEYVLVRIRTDLPNERYISPEMTVMLLKYETPETSQAHFPTPNNWIVWEGFKSFDYYYESYSQMKEQQQTPSPPN
jgi:hypothetical protein